MAHRILEQKWLSTSQGHSKISLTRVKLTSTSDSITLPRLKGNNNIAALRDHNDASVTVSASNGTDNATVTMTGSLGDETWVVGIHSHMSSSPVNFDVSGN